MLCRNSIKRVAAALQYSDNTAANLLLDQIGGPSSLQAALHGLVDTATHDDIAIAGPPAGAPLVIAVESDRRTQNATSGDALIADATKTGLAALN